LVTGQPHQIEDKPKQKQSKSEAALVSDARAVSQPVP
jgi:hypothetical protein